MLTFMVIVALSIVGVVIVGAITPREPELELQEY